MKMKIVLSFGIALHGALLADPLHIAAAQFRHERVASLLKSGERVNNGVMLQLRPLHCAALGANRWLGPGEDESREKTFNTLIEYAQKEDACAISALDAWGWTPLDYATYYGQNEVAQLLRSNGGKAVQQMSLAPVLHRAVFRNKGDLFPGLLRNNRDSINEQDVCGRTPLHLAAMLGHDVHLDALLEAGAAVDTADSQGWTPLMYALYFGRWSVISDLLDAGANPNATDKDSNTPFMIAARGDDVASDGCIRYLEKLMRAGADVNHRNKCKETALHAAAAVGHGQVFKYILELVSDKNPRNNRDQTPLMTAAIRGRMQVFEVLTKSFKSLDSASKEEIGSWLTATTSDGVTLLHHAATMGHFSVVLHLLDLGLDPAARTAAGFSVLDCASSGLEDPRYFKRSWQRDEFCLQIPYSMTGKQKIVDDFKIHKLG